VADINDRLDRLQRREEFDRFGRPIRPAPPETPVGPVVARPAGVDDRLGEVLDAVAGVVRKHPGLSVMVALADGRAGRPVIRVTEREGGVETGVVVVGQSAVEPARTDPEATSVVLRPPPDLREQPTAAPAREPVPGSDPVFEPALRDSLPSRAALAGGRVPNNGRHAAAGAEPEPAPARASWHDALWSAAGRDRFRPPADQPGAAEPVEPVEPDGDEGTSPTIPIPEDTSQVVSRLAQMLRDNPTLAANWSREAPE
jgi:hypothetical protein